MTTESLSGLRILDLSRLTPGAYATLLAADMGADVVKVEQPGSGDYLRTLVPPAFLYLCRNKKSVTLDLKTDAGRAVFYRLCESADIVVESFRPGVCARLGIDYATLLRVNPRIIMCSLSGFGQSGPYRDRSGHDLNYLGVAGALSLMGEPLGPPSHSTGIAVADFNASMFTVLSLVSAVLARERFGVGQYIDVSMTDCMSSWMGRYVAEHMSDTNRTRQAMMSRPGYGVYLCADGKYLTLGCVEDVFWQNLISALPAEHELQGYRASERREANQGTVEELLGRLFADRPRDTWLAQLEVADVPVAPVNMFEEIHDDPQLRARNLFVDNPDNPGVPYQRFPVLSSTNANRPPERAPAMGENTNEILTEAGYGLDEIDALRRNGVI